MAVGCWGCSQASPHGCGVMGLLPIFPPWLWGAQVAPNLPPMAVGCWGCSQTSPMAVGCWGCSQSSPQGCGVLGMLPNFTPWLWGAWDAPNLHPMAVGCLGSSPTSPHGCGVLGMLPILPPWLWGAGDAPKLRPRGIQGSRMLGHPYMGRHRAGFWPSTLGGCWSPPVALGSPLPASPSGAQQGRSWAQTAALPCRKPC